MIKKASEEDLKNLKNEIQEKKVTLGTEVVLKKLKLGSLLKVYLAKNCPAVTKADIEYYAHLKKVPIVELEMSNEELGLFCKKGYFISVIGSE